jgi:hypothetical protein
MRCRTHSARRSEIGRTACAPFAPSGQSDLCLGGSAFQISDPAPEILDCQPYRHRRVHCIWPVGQTHTFQSAVNIFVAFCSSSSLTNISIQSLLTYPAPDTGPPPVKTRISSKSIWKRTPAASNFFRRRSASKVSNMPRDRNPSGASVSAGHSSTSSSSPASGGCVTGVGSQDSNGFPSTEHAEGSSGYS